MWQTIGRNLVLTAGVVASSPGMAAEFAADIRPLLKKFCFECHADSVTEAEIDLGAFAEEASLRQSLRVWIKVREMLDSGQMPPPDAPQPSDAERLTLRTWVRAFLTREAEAHAGDPGPVVLRRLNNAEYTYTLRDLTGVESLDPAREFPVDGAAGEGFTNTGSGQAMSPALVQKYLDAAKQVADHAVLTPSGIRFSAAATRRDQTDELLAQIREFYARFSAAAGGSAVDLQGIQFETNQGGRLPLVPYLEATLAERDRLRGGAAIDDVAAERRLNAKYLRTLWTTLAADPAEGDAAGSFLLHDLRRRWQAANPGDAPALAAHIAGWQGVLWKFNTIGHIGKTDGPKSWIEATAPLVDRQEFKVALPEAPLQPVVLQLVVRALGGDASPPVVQWQAPRLVFLRATTPTEPVLLRDVRAVTARVEAFQALELPRTADYLRTLDEAQRTEESLDTAAARTGLDPQMLAHWGACVGLGRRSQPEITGHATTAQRSVHNYDAVNGWAGENALGLLTNRSENAITFSTLTVPARGVTVHPSPRQAAIVAWRSPLAGRLQIAGLVADADDKCGNGAAWRVEHRSEITTRVVAQGVLESAGRQTFEAEAAVEIAVGDVLALVIDPRDGDHTCDTTHVDLTLTEQGGEGRAWNLANDLVDHVLEGNPLADAYGHPETWHFCAGGAPTNTDVGVPTESSLGRWRVAVLERRPADEIASLAAEVHRTMTTAAGNELTEVDRTLRQRLLVWSGPLDWLGMRDRASAGDGGAAGLDPALFGHLPEGGAIDTADLCVPAPQSLEVHLPAHLAAGAEFVAGVQLLATESSGCVQVVAGVERVDPAAVNPALPLLTSPSPAARERAAAALDEFRQFFPPALCYTAIVPVDEVVTLRLFYREDDHLQRLMLDDAEAAELDRLWDELWFVSQEPLQLTVAFEQLAEFATQDRPDLVTAFEPLRVPISERAAEFRAQQLAAEPVHLQAVLDLAGRAWRRPLTDGERDGLKQLYGDLRGAEIPHEEATRLVLARVLTSPAFLYKLEQPTEGTAAAPVTDLELASRLSYFLWSSQPDNELRRVAQERRLSAPDELQVQTRRMLQSPLARRMAIQFACQWFHLRDFDANDDKNERLFPEFAALRGPMYAETVQFFEHLIRDDGSILEILDADHAYLNGPLAAHYGLIDVAGDDWRRVEGVRTHGRGGILAMASFLASQSGASRTSPILRGNWVYETLLGERLPKPPANVPQLPETPPEGLTERQLIEQHSSDPACAKCHVRIDPFGFALEQYDAIGRLRAEAADTRTRLPDGHELVGLDGLKAYLMTVRRDDFVRHFCRKLLGYALGREVQLSDEPLLAELQRRLEADGYRFHTAVETIVASRQFREIRGRDATSE